MRVDKLSTVSLGAVVPLVLVAVGVSQNPAEPQDELRVAAPAVTPAISESPLPPEKLGSPPPPPDLPVGAQRYGGGIYSLPAPEGAVAVVTAEAAEAAARSEGGSEAGELESVQLRLVGDGNVGGDPVARKYVNRLAWVVAFARGSAVSFGGNMGSSSAAPRQYDNCRLVAIVDATSGQHLNAVLTCDPS